MKKRMKISEINKAMDEINNRKLTKAQIKKIDSVIRDNRNEDSNEDVELPQVAISQIDQNRGESEQQNWL